jgi:hypothetical protein
MIVLPLKSWYSFMSEFDCCKLVLVFDNSCIFAFIC